jgi:tripartite-type tricarboxylate transporter receptor subunit TctC
MQANLGERHVDKREQRVLAVIRPRRVMAAAAVASLALTACGADAAEEETAAPEVEAVGDAEDLDLTEARDFYEGNTVTWVVPFDPGGGHDAYPRLLAPYLEEELGSDVVIENQPGGGGLIGVNQVLADPDPDGLTLLNFSGTGIMQSAIAGGDDHQFEIEDIAWLGRFVGEPTMISTATDGDLETWDEVMAGQEMSYGITGTGSSTHYNFSMLTEIFDLDAREVSGYAGGPEMVLGLASGDIDLFSGSVGSTVGRVDAGELNPVLFLSEEPHGYLDDVPTVFDYEMSEEHETMMRAHVSIPETHRPIVANAGVPEDRLQVLVEAIEAALENPDFQADAEEQGLELDVRGPDFMSEAVANILDAPPEYAQFLADATE